MKLRGVLLAVVLVAASLAPSTATAQKNRFVDALIAFRTALNGAYGDEGPQIEAALDTMASSLGAWDDQAAAAETELRRGLPDAAPEDRLRRWIELATLKLDRDQWAAGLENLDAAVAANNDRAFVYLARGMVRDAAGDAKGAVSDFRRAWELDRGDPVKAYLLVTRGLASGGLDDPGPPLDALMAAHEGATRDAPPVFMELGLLRDRAEWPVLAPSAYADGFALVADGRYGEAVASFRAAAARDPLLIDPAARTEGLARGSASLRVGHHAAAVTHLEAAVADSPGSAEAHRLLGTAYHLAQRPAESLEHLATAIRLAPSDERARLALARALLAQERRGEAEAALHAAMAALPDPAEAQWLLAQMQVQDERGLEAIGALEALASAPTLVGRGQVLWLLADQHSRRDDFDAMTRALSLRVRRDLNNPVVHKEFGFAHLKRGDRQQALAELLLTALFAPDDVETLARIGQIHLDDGRYAAAEAVLRHVLALAPDQARSRFALGMALLHLGRDEEGHAELMAFKRLTVAKREAEARTIEYERLVRSAERSAGDGRFDEAIAALERAATIVEDDPRVYQLLASVYGAVRRLDDRAQALAAYERIAGERAVER